MLRVGQKAPAFNLQDQDGEIHTLKGHAGSWLIIYFYPKDDTPGCTKEACAIADVYKDFKRLGVTVIGMSKDTVRSHKRFAEKYNLPFILLADEDMSVITKYGAFKEKKMFGKAVRGTHRISYLIDPDGKVAKVYRKVDPASHALELLADLEAFQKTKK